MKILDDYEQILLNEAIMGRVHEVSKKAKNNIDFVDDISQEIVDLMNLLNKLLNLRDDNLIEQTKNNKQSKSKW